MFTTAIAEGDADVFVAAEMLLEVVDVVVVVEVEEVTEAASVSSFPQPELEKDKC